MTEPTSDEPQFSPEQKAIFAYVVKTFPCATCNAKPGEQCDGTHKPIGRMLVHKRRYEDAVDAVGGDRGNITSASVVRGKPSKNSRGRYTPDGKRVT